jgi:hypothetical protein
MCWYGCECDPFGITSTCVKKHKGNGIVVKLLTSNRWEGAFYGGDHNSTTTFIYKQDDWFNCLI